jgi:hypothetical protein
MQSRELQRLRKLQKENARLIIDARARRKRLLAERDLDVDILKEIAQKTSDGFPEANRNYLSHPSQRLCPAASLSAGGSGSLQQRAVSSPGRQS